MTTFQPDINIREYDYRLPEERIAKYPLAERDSSKLLLFRNGKITDHRFGELPQLLPPQGSLVFNETRVVRARIIMRKESGARIEIMCLEPEDPADHERAFAAKGNCSWHCMVGNSKKWKHGKLVRGFEVAGSNCELYAERDGDTVRFSWGADLTFGQLLETLGRTPIPPYLGRDSEDIDNERYQTVYSRYDGSVAAPTAGLHFTTEVLDRIAAGGTRMTAVTLHVGAGTFLPVKPGPVSEHNMHTEHFSLTLGSLREIIADLGNITAVGTTTVRTLESLPVIGRRMQNGVADPWANPVGQWEAYDMAWDTDPMELLLRIEEYMVKNDIWTVHGATQVMIVPGFRFRIVNRLITNFHQPCSTLLLLVGAFTGGWREIYDHALARDYRFLSYGDSSLLYRAD